MKTESKSLRQVEMFLETEEGCLALKRLHENYERVKRTLEEQCQIDPAILREPMTPFRPRYIGKAQ